MQHDRIEIGPHSFWVARAGSGAGTPVILIHGMGGSSDWWRHNIDAVAAEHRVAAVDLIGTGRNRFVLRRSRLPPGLGEIAAVLARWIESEFAQTVHLVGNSMGGHVAIYLAAARPDLVRSLVLVDTTGLPMSLNPLPHLRNLFVPDGALSAARLLARDFLRTGLVSLLLALLRVLRDDVRPLLHALTMPVLLVWGNRDPFVPLSYARRLAALLPRARLAVIPGAGHMPMWERPAAFNQEVLAFLREVDRC
jgi:pimeloyl-ACP methyl ester carboxylesterase